MKKPQTSRRRKIHNELMYWDWDYINSLSHENTCPYLLTEREVGALLTFMETMGWITRWRSPTNQVIDLDFIQGLCDGIDDKLMRDDDCPADPCEDGCIDYLPNSSFIRYEPNDPFRTPLLVPPGYTYIPWYTNPLIPLPGVIPTDAMVNQIAVFGPDLPASGFPRFSFEFDGRGEVEIELVNVPAGGFCLVVVDSNLSSVKIVNTSSNILDIISLAGILAALGIDSEDANVVDTDIIEIDIETVGHHRIDVTFLPNIGGETFLGFGGGLRRVTFCGPILAVEEMYLQRANPDDPCLIEQSTDGGITWQEAWRMDGCCDDNNPTRVVDGIIEESPDGGITWTPIDNDPRFIGLTLPPRTETEAKCNAAQSTIDMIRDHFEQLSEDVTVGAAVTGIVAAIIALLAIVVSLGTLTPLIVPLAAALFWAGGAAIDAAMDAAVYDALFCLIYCHSEDDGSYTEAGWQALRAAIPLDVGIPAGLATTLSSDYITLLGPVGLSNAASYNPTATGDCSECECPNCSDKAFAGIDVTDFDHGSILSRNPDGTITCELQPSGPAAGYLIIRFDTLGDCCYINSFSQDSGASAGAAFIPCGTPYDDGNYVIATPVGQCCQYAQFQGAAGAIITITLSDCP